MFVLYLINSNIMTNTGIYRSIQLSHYEASTLINNADIIKSNVGHDEVIDVIHQISGLKFEVNRNKQYITDMIGFVLSVSLYNGTHLDKSLLYEYKPNRLYQFNFMIYSNTLIEIE